MEALEQKDAVPEGAPDLELWSKIARENGFREFLSASDGFSRTTTSGRRWGSQNCPGIYFWLAADGEAYVGQSVRPQSRLRQHMRAHGDILVAASSGAPGNRSTHWSRSWSTQSGTTSQ